MLCLLICNCLSGLTSLFNYCWIYFWRWGIPDQSSFVCNIPFPKGCINVDTLRFFYSRSWKHKWKCNFCWIVPANLFDLNKENVRSISVWLVRINWIAPDGEVLMVVIDKAVRATKRPTVYWHGEVVKLVNWN